MNIRKLILVFATLFVVSHFTIRQSVIVAQEWPVSKSEKVFKEPDIIPMYTGGTAEMHRFIANTLQYPADAVQRNAQGLVVYTFVVEKDGTLSNFSILHRADSLLNNEALRILQHMPPWRPARINGEIVRSETYVPMYFRLNANARRSAAAAPRVNTKTDLAVIQNNDIYTIVDKMPEYSTGERGLGDFISRSLRYPRKALQDGIEGRILCSFIVGADGAVSNIEVVQGLEPALNDEAVRILSLMPRWIPGENNGEKVNVKCLLPIDFVIDEDPIPPLTTVQ